MVRVRRPGCRDVSAGEDHDVELEVESDKVNASLWARDLQLLWPSMSLKVKGLLHIRRKQGLSGVHSKFLLYYPPLLRCCSTGRSCRRSTGRASWWPSTRGWMLTPCTAGSSSRARSPSFH